MRILELIFFIIMFVVYIVFVKSQSKKVNELEKLEEKALKKYLEENWEKSQFFLLCGHPFLKSHVIT